MVKQIRARRGLKGFKVERPYVTQHEFARVCTLNALGYSQRLCETDFLTDPNDPTISSSDYKDPQTKSLNDQHQDHHS